MMRPIQALISRAALQHNFAIVREQAKQSKIMAVVKANAYGHGLIPVAHALHDADGFAMLNIAEAIDLREAGFEQPLLLLEGVFGEQELRLAASFDISIVVHHASQLAMLEQAKLIKPVGIYLKMNTGMNRLGFMPQDFIEAYQHLAVCSNVNEITLMTHFATADEAVGIEKPLACFEQAVATLKAPVSLANSATILRYPNAHKDWVRPGIMLYGATPVSGTPAAAFGLNPVMRLHSQLISIQSLAAGESVGYGATFTADKPMRIGIVACGYADGYPRHAPTGTPISIAGAVSRTVGRVSMDMLFCDITDIPDATVGSAVQLWGDIVPVDDVAEMSGTVGYELLCAVAPRVPMHVLA